MIRLAPSNPHTVTTTAGHVEIIADRYGSGVSIVGGYYATVVRKPGREPIVYRAPVPVGEVAS
jgi:hypothetical protein